MNVRNRKGVIQHALQFLSLQAAVGGLLYGIGKAGLLNNTMFSSLWTFSSVEFLMQMGTSECRRVLFDVVGISRCNWAHLVLAWYIHLSLGTWGCSWVYLDVAG